MVAHGASRGAAIRPRREAPEEGRKKTTGDSVAPARAGGDAVRFFPGLTPWATVCRPCGLGNPVYTN